MAIPEGEWIACDRQLSNALDRLRRTAERHPSRELSLAITKLQEGRHWLGEVTSAPPAGEDPRRLP